MYRVVIEGYDRSYHSTDNITVLMSIVKDYVTNYEFSSIIIEYDVGGKENV